MEKIINNKINFKFQVKVAEREFIHVRVYQDLKQNIHLHGVEHNKEEDDELKYFDQNV